MNENECNVCDGSGWVLVERGDITAAKRCVCREVRNSAVRETPLTLEAAAEATTILCELLDFAPSSDASRAVIADALMSMCATVEQVRWLVLQTAQRHVKWSACGIPGLREILCSKYIARDGLTICSSEAYPERIPTEKPLTLAVTGQTLPPVHAVSTHPHIESAVPDLSNARRMPADSKGLRIVPALVRPIARVDPDPAAPNITQADIDREVERLRLAKAR